ncbi:hypothetical protein GGR52DRAFT_182492 [Hypoxylon sp. FL1284]|nr:hypothetical protein GGR52DRAFT_182492 [Hypoxylon sp. FL1284]
MAAKLITLLAAASVATASPFLSRREVGHSKGFKLVASVAGGDAKNLTVPIDGAFLGGAHVGAGLNLAVLNITDGGVTFFQNGTAAEVKDAQSTISSDGGTPLNPYGLQAGLDTADPRTPYGVTLDAGAGTPGITLTAPADGQPGELVMGPASFIACDESIAYYGPDRRFAVVKDLDASRALGDLPTNIPDNCVRVSLRPLCTELGTLPPGSLSSHEFANEVPCNMVLPGPR